MRSMTAYGQARVSLDALDIALELKTVNGRYLDIVFRGPKELASLEPEVRERISSILNRGRVEVCLNLVLRSSDLYDLNVPLAENYKALGEQARAQGFEGALSLKDLLQLPGALVPKPLESIAENFSGAVFSALEEALAQVVECRESEGRLLRNDFLACLQRLEETVREIRTQVEDLTSYYRAKLREKIARLAEERIVDESRLAQEIIFHSERADVSEELTRLQCHIDRFRQALEGNAVCRGKHLEFLCQEMNREMNTILAKASLAGVSEAAVTGKVEIEKIREQVQNVE